LMEDMVVRKVLSLHPKNAKEENLLGQAREAFTTILRFHGSITSFYRHTVAESVARDAQRDGELVGGTCSTFS